MGISDLGYLTDRRAMACPKPATRLEDTMAARKLTTVNERDFKQEIWKRDAGQCRCCLRKVIKTVARVPEQGQVHHIHGRVGDLRFESRSALLLCKKDHERVTGRVNTHRLVIVATQTFEMRGEQFTDARYPVVFREITGFDLTVS